MSYRARRARSNWPLSNEWKPPPYQQNEIIADSHENYNDGEANQPDIVYGGPLNIHGYYYNVKTKKYFRIPSESCPVQKYSHQNYFRNKGQRNRNHLNNQERNLRMEHARAAKFSANRPRYSSGTFLKRPVTQPLSKMLADLEVGSQSLHRVQRHIDEMRLLNHNIRPSLIIRTPLTELNAALGCEFLDISENGDRLVGSFSIPSNIENSQRHRFRSHTSVYVFDVDTVSEIVQNECKKREEDLEKGIDNGGYNTLGLVIQPVNSEEEERTNGDYRNYTTSNKRILYFEDVVVDQVLAQIDSDVVGMLTVTAVDVLDRRTYRNVSSCAVHLNALAELSNPECSSSLESPIYNRIFKDRDIIWSVGWNGPNMSVGFGMENKFRIENILANRGYILSSRKKNVISHCFSNDGNLVFMGLRGDDVIRSDLRMNRDHITGSLIGSRSSGNVKVMKEVHPECVLTEGFDSKIRLWDFRWPNRPIMTFNEHQNEVNRLPVFVDPKEKFVFAVGNDAVTRGWSLITGDLLCSVKVPRPSTTRKMEFPRVIYSDRLGGRAGNAALLIAVDDTMRIHFLDI